MIQILFGWLWLGVSAFLCGFAALKAMDKIGGVEQTKPLDLILVVGLCILTVYAQIFSLFSGVGAISLVILLLLCSTVFIRCHAEIMTYVKLLPSASGFWWKAGSVCLLAAITLVISSTGAHHYDTDLYHAQSIRWIEEYGIVPGLGNLHNRLAYNSSIFSLQALFSFRFLFDTPLHSVNGFVAIVLGGQAFCTFRFFDRRKIAASDCFRLLLIVFLFSESVKYISSPGSDTLALGLVIYILEKWIDYLDKGVDDNVSYAVLCLLGVYALTVKLSAAMIILLVVKPATDLLKRKKWSETISYIALGIAIVLPFLIRNVIISGYLVYPYPELDLFCFDWEMPKYTSLYDRNEIKAWGWGLCDVNKYNASITEWFPVWLENLGILKSSVFVLNLILVVPCIIMETISARTAKNWSLVLTALVIIACMFFWFISAPLPRYGSVFLFLLPAFTLGRIAESQNGKMSIQILTRAILLCCILLCTRSIDKYTSGKEASILQGCGYRYFEVMETEFENVPMFYPSFGDQTGYYPFPATPYVERLDFIEMRDGSLEDGFRMKDAYKDCYISTYGTVQEFNMFE